MQKEEHSSTEEYDDEEYAYLNRDISGWSEKENDMALPANKTRKKKIGKPTMAHKVLEARSLNDTSKAATPKVVTAMDQMDNMIAAISKARKKKKVVEVEGDPFPVTGKPSVNIEGSKVTLGEKEYNRLREIELSLRDLFNIAKKLNGTVAFGRLDPKYKEPKLVSKLRGLLGVDPYVPPTKDDNQKGSDI